MRATAKAKGVTVKAYAGTTGVLLAFDVTAAKRKGLLGFAIERRDPRRAAPEWLRGMLTFPGQPRLPGVPIDSNVGPIQKFRWSDYRVFPDSSYSYTVHPVHGKPDALKIGPGPTVRVRTASLTKGPHRVIFNRAAAASQAFALKFPELDAKLDKAKSAEAKQKVIESEPGALAWLSRGVAETILRFIQGAQDQSWALDVAIYEYELPAIVEAIEAAHSRGVNVRVVYHAKPGDPVTAENEHSLGGLPDDAGIKRARVTSAICHHKFIVLSRMEAGRRKPQAVLCGSTNFTHNGVYRQANVVHVATEDAISEKYLDLFEVLFRGDTPVQTRAYVNQNNPLDLGRPTFAGFSPRSGQLDLKAFAAEIGTARRDVLFCTAFDLFDDIEAALLGKPHDPILRYGLQNSRSKITGIHADRSADFTATAMLSTGLEGFLKETTKGQRGNILIHTKLVVVDFTSDSPVVISGSHNLSRNGSLNNDENYLVIRGNADVADCYGCELMRLYDHYRFRFRERSRPSTGEPRKPLVLAEDDSWTDRYFTDEPLTIADRLRFSGN